MSETSSIPTFSRIISSIALGMEDNPTTLDPTSGPGHEKTNLKRIYTPDIKLSKILDTLDLVRTCHP